MKLILRADVENLGILGDVVEVKAGYGRNFLLPQGLAMVASPSNLKAFEQERKKLQARMDAVRSEALALQASLEALDVVIPMHVGDNDKLGALVTNLVEAEVLVILTDQQGLYTADPRKDPQATLIAEARAGDPALEAMAGGAGSSIGKGGMLTKILAAKHAAGSGTSTVIAWGREHNVLLRLCQGESIGTALLAPTQKLQARKQWMLDHLQLPGAVQVDAGAAAKLQTAGKSLLP